MDDNTATQGNPAAARVADGKLPITQEQLKAFLAKRNALREKHGSGSEARAKILTEFELTQEETMYLLNQELWNLFNSRLSDAEILAEAAE